MPLFNSNLKEGIYGSNRPIQLNVKKGIKNPSNDFKLEREDFLPLMESLKEAINERLKLLAKSKIANTNNFNFVDIEVARELYKKHKVLFEKILKSKDVFKKFETQLQDLLDNIFSKQNLSTFSDKNIETLHDNIVDLIVEEYEPKTSGIGSVNFPKIITTKSQLESIIKLTKTYKINKQTFLKKYKKQIFKYTEKYFDSISVDEEVKKEISWKIADLFKTEVEKADELRREQFHWSHKEMQKKNKKFLKELGKSLKNMEIRQNEDYEEETSLKEAFIKDLENNADLGKNQSNFLRKMVFVKIRNRMKKLDKNLKTTLNLAINIAKNVGQGLNTTRKVLMGFGKDLLGVMLGPNRAASAKHFFANTLRLGTLGAWVSLKYGIKGLSLLTKGLFLIIGPIFKGLRIATKFVFGVIKGAFSLVKNTLVGFKNKVIGLYGFIKKHIFSKRLWKFLRSDAGAVFLGTMGALIKYYIIDPIKDMFKPIGFDINGIELTMFDDFLNKHQNIATVYDTARNTIIDVKGAIQTKDFTLIPSLDTLIGIGCRMYNFLNSIWNVIKLVATYRFTALALKNMKFKGNFVMQLIGIGAGFALDLILNSSFGHKKKDKDDNNNMVMGVNLEVLTNGKKHRFSDSNYAHEQIRRAYKGDKNKTKTAIEKYDKLNDSIAKEETELEDLSDEIAAYDEGFGVDKVSKFVLNDELYAMFNRFRTSYLMGYEHIIPGYDHIPEDFEQWSKSDQIQFFKDAVEYRKWDLENLRKRLDQYGNKGNQIDIEEFLGKVETQQQSFVGVTDPTKDWQTNVKRGHGGWFDNKEYLYSLPEYHATSLGSDIDKIEKFKGLATFAAEQMTQYGKQRGLRQNILIEGIKDFETRLKTGNQDDIKRLEQMMSLSKEDQEKAVRNFLKEMLAAAREDSIKKQAKKPENERTGLAVLSMEELYQDNVVIPETEWQKMKKTVEDLVEKEGDEWRKTHTSQTFRTAAYANIRLR